MSEPIRAAQETRAHRRAAWSVGGVLAALVLCAHPARPGGDTTLALPSLSAPVRIVTDRYGIPHLRARTLPDLYFAWGFVTARDRLWQLEYSRRSGRGRLWEWFGNDALRADGGAQLFELGSRAERIWQRERADTAAAPLVLRYTDGINAWIDLCRRGVMPWPREFTRLERRPEPWRPADTVLILLGLGVTLDLDLPELDEGEEIAAHGAAWAARRRRFENQWIYDTIPDSAAGRMSARSPGSVEGATAMRHDARTTRPHAGEPGVFPMRAGHGAALDPELLARARAALGPWLRSAAGEEDARASNEFAVGPRRSASGAPMLANDPHLHLATPGPFHVIHISVPGVVEAIGAAVPGLPAIVSGRSVTCAWGVTALSADVCDVYADTLSADGRQVRWHGGWAPVREASYDMRFRVFGIPLPPFGQVRRYTPHGPVVVFDRKRRVALSVRWSVEDDRVTLARMVGVERSVSADEVAGRYRSLTTPCINLLAADRAGHVVYQTTGSVPRRAADPGLGPLPGDGRHEWLGIIPPERMPRWQAPPAGFVVNSNNRPIRPGAGETLYGYDTFVQDRALRIAQRLGGDRSVTLADMRSVQNDIYSRAGERAVPLLLAAADSLPGRLTPRMRAALDSLRGWDLYARRSSVATTIYRAWMGALQRRSRTEGLQGLTLAALAGRAPEALRAPGSERPERAAEAAIAALDTALRVLAAKLGPDPARWRWGNAHRARFGHPIAERLNDPPATWEPGALPVDGDASTPAVASSRMPWSFDVTHGPAFRHVVDLAVVDSSLGVIPPWNASDQGGTRARNHARLWASHGYVPFYLSWPRIEAAREDALELTPARAPRP